MMEILAARAADGLRVVAVLHDLNLAALFCPRLVLLAGGAVVADGPPAELLTPDRLRAVYGDKLDVLPHPRSGQPLVLAATS
jgi:iron complex transport system ATP-binding protein